MKTKLSILALLAITLPNLIINIALAQIPDDSACTIRGGVCMNASACTGTSTAGLCSGGAERQCCITAKKDSQTTITIPNPLKATSITKLIDNIVNYLIGIATILLPLAVVYSAYLFMSSGGDMEKVTKARHALTWTVVGYLLILISKGITTLLANILGAK